ncbi:MAG: AAA family ATPase, partial [bacterium]
CPECGKPLTLGVLYRVEQLATREEGIKPKTAAPFTSLIPLKEIIGEVNSVGPNSKKVAGHYEALLEKFGPELIVLQHTDLEDLKKYDTKLSQALSNLRQDKVTRQAGYDGEFGVIKTL